MPLKKTFNNKHFEKKHEKGSSCEPFPNHLQKAHKPKQSSHPKIRNSSNLSIAYPTEERHKTTITNTQEIKPTAFTNCTICSISSTLPHACKSPKASSSKKAKLNRCALLQRKKVALNKTFKIVDAFSIAQTIFYISSSFSFQHSHFPASLHQKNQKTHWLSHHCSLYSLDPLHAYLRIYQQ
jgi:hypothetical protein